MLALLTAPAHADVPEGWGDQTEHNSLDALHALGALPRRPLLLFVLIALAVYLPAMIRGEKLLPDHAGPAAALPRASGSADPARASPSCRQPTATTREQVAQVAAGELTGADRLALDRTIRLAEQSCRFEFSVFVGPAEADDTRAGRPGCTTGSWCPSRAC